MLASLTPCLRHRSATGTPASCSFKIPMICCSEKRLRFVLWPSLGPERTSNWNYARGARLQIIHEHDVAMIRLDLARSAIFVVSFDLAPATPGRGGRLRKPDRLRRPRMIWRQGRKCNNTQPGPLDRGRSTVCYRLCRCRTDLRMRDENRTYCR